jgi:hypothetical protein
MASRKKAIMYNETLPFLNYIDVSSEWLDKKVKRQEIWDSIRQQRKDMTNLTYEIKDIEKKMAEIITRLKKKN